jgi:hypothetical protein
METAGGDRFSSSAARAKLRCFATEAKTRNCRKDTFFIGMATALAGFEVVAFPRRRSVNPTFSNTDV